MNEQTAKAFVYFRKVGPVQYCWSNNSLSLREARGKKNGQKLALMYHQILGTLYIVIKFIAVSRRINK